MNPNPDPLEKLINETVRDLPLRRAPRSLEARVFAEIARRQALPWWQQSLSKWPAVVRWTFLIVSATLAAAMIVGCVTLLRTGSFDAILQSLSGPVEFGRSVWAAGRALTGLGQNLMELIPAPWFYGTLAGIALLYAMVFSIGAAAYRTLYQSR